MARPVILAAAALLLVPLVAACSSADDCNSKPCLDSVCSCGSYAQGVACETSYEEVIGTPAWLTYLSAVGAAHAALCVASVVGLIRTFRGKSWRNGTIRDTILFMNGLGNLCRVIWLADPVAENGLWTKELMGVFWLRLPQLLWMMCFLTLVNAWITLVQDKAPAWLFRGSIAIMIILAIVGFPVALVAASLGSFVLAQITNLLFLIATLAIATAGIMFSRRLHKVLQGFARELARRQKESAAFTMSARRKHIIKLMNSVRLTALTASGTVLQLLVFEIILVVIRKPAIQHPVLQMVFLFDVHLITEGLVSLCLVYTCWGESATRQKRGGGQALTAMSQHEASHASSEVVNPVHGVKEGNKV